MVGARADGKGQGQLQVHWQVWRPWLSLGTAMAAGSHDEHMAMEAGDGGQAGVCKSTAGGNSCR